MLTASSPRADATATPAPYLLFGSFAYDTVLLHNGAFHARILPEAIARLNVAFGVDVAQPAFGGTGGNIAYNAGLLGDRPLLIGCLGHDHAAYCAHLLARGQDPTTLTCHATLPTAHAWVLTDTSNNQITAFNAGAMAVAPAVPAVTPPLWHLAPAQPIDMARLAQLAIARGQRYFFDPGQALPGFCEPAVAAVMPLAELLVGATGIFVNEYEAELLHEYTGRPLSYWLRGADHFVVRTRGGAGLELSTAEGTYPLAAAPAARVVDPTGCGDALRAGFLHGFVRGWPLARCAQWGATLGSFAIESLGGQQHAPALSALVARHAAAFTHISA